MATNYIVLGLFCPFFVHDSGGYACLKKWHVSCLKCASWTVPRPKKNVFAFLKPALSWEYPQRSNALIIIQIGRVLSELQWILQNLSEIGNFRTGTLCTANSCNDRFHDSQLCYIVQAPPFQIPPIPQFQRLLDSTIPRRLLDSMIVMWFDDSAIATTSIPRLLDRAIPPMVFVQTGNMIPFNVCRTNIERVSLWNIKCYFLINSMKTYSMFVLQTG